jgi:uncharacterized protein YndB with AHSA1/START domain
MRGLLAIALLVLVVSPSDDHLDELARSGNIQENAPVKASLEITINAPREKVWGLLTDVNGWPKWQRDITKANISGPLQSGTAFTWTAGTNIQSRIALVQPLEQLAWTGTAYKAKAIHVWKLQGLPDGRALGKTSESMEGFMLKVFYSSEKLKESDQHWLNYLKAAAEQ